MTRGVVATAMGVLLALPVEQSAPLSVVLEVDVTASVSDAMATVLVSTPVSPRADGTGSFERPPKAEVTRRPNSPRDLFQTPIADGFIRRLAPDDRATIGSISRTLRLSSQFSRDRGVLFQTTREVLEVPDEDRYGPTPLWDAIDSATTALEVEPGRRAIVLVTDGLSSGNGLSLDTVIEHAVRSRVIVSVVCEAWGPPRIGPAAQSVNVGDHAVRNRWHVMAPLDKTPDVNLKRLTSATGGLFLMDGRDGSDPKPDAALASILEYLHHP